MGVVSSRILGALLVMSGAAWSPWAVDVWIGSARLEPWPLRAGCWLVSASLAGVGLASMRRRAPRALLRLGWTLLALVCVLPLAAEAFLRAGLAAGRPELRRPALYADPMGDEDYWLMRAHWFGDSLVSPRALDPELGWCFPETPANPLGFLTEGRRQIDPAAPALLVFGDSFVAGPNPIQEQLPQQLDPLLPELPVLNYGNGGYGLDQICLLVERYLPRYPRGHFVVGVMTFDLDRAVLRYFCGQKPWVELEDGALVVRGQPVDMDPPAWLARHPPAIRSYALALLVRQARALLWGPGNEGPYRRAEKIELTTRLFERLVASTRAQGRPTLFVLFSPRERIEAPGWREALCRELLERHEVDWIDATAALLDEARARGEDVQRYFRPGDNHPTGEANAILARAIAARVRALGWPEGARRDR